MLRRFFILLAGLGLLAWLASGVLMFLTTKSGLHISIQDSPQDLRTGIDPVLGLTEEVRVVQRDLQTLAAGLRAGVVRQAEPKRSDPDPRLDQITKQLSQATEELRRTQNLLTQQAAAQEQLAREQLAQLASKSAEKPPSIAAEPVTPAASASADKAVAEAPAESKLTDSGSPPTDRSTSAPTDPGIVDKLPGANAPGTGGSLAAADRVLRETVQPTSASTDQTVTPDAGQTQKGKSAFAFELPSESLRYDKPQRFEIISSLSRVGFDAKSTLHSFTGVASGARGQLIATLMNPQEGSSAKISVASKLLSTGHDKRDAEMVKRLEIDAHPEIAFELKRFTTERLDVTPVLILGTAEGTMSIHGVIRELRIPVKLSFDEGHRLLIEGETTLKLSDYGISAPSTLGVFSMEDEIKLWIALRARAMGAPLRENF